MYRHFPLWGEPHASTEQSNLDAKVRRPRRISVMKRTTQWLVPVVALGGIAAGLYYWQQRSEHEAPPPAVSMPPPSAAPKVQAEPGIRHPIQDGVAGTAQPVLSAEESDKALSGALAGLFGQKSVADLFYLDEIVRRFVVTVDNLPRKKVPSRLMPVKPTPRQFLTTADGQSVFINVDNYRRYMPWSTLAEAVDTKQLVAAYVRFYPLFQRAYQEQGYPSGYFNDRLIDAIDDMLAAPEIQGPVKLVQPKVLYQFADPDLEARSAGQKIMIRMGNDNADKIKAKLAEIRRELTGSVTK